MSECIRDHLISGGTNFTRKNSSANGWALSINLLTRYHNRIEMGATDYILDKSLTQFALIGFKLCGCGGGGLR